MLARAPRRCGWRCGNGSSCPRRNAEGAVISSMRPPGRVDVGDSSARRGLAGWLGGGSPGLRRGGYAGVRWPDSRLHEVQGHTLRVLVFSQALGGLGMSIGIAVAALLAEQVSGSEKLAGLAQTMQVLGAAVASFLLAHVMGRRGRRVGLSVGYTIGASGAALAVVAGVIGSFPLLLFCAPPFRATTPAEKPTPPAAPPLG